MLDASMSHCQLTGAHGFLDGLFKATADAPYQQGLTNSMNVHALSCFVAGNRSG